MNSASWGYSPTCVQDCDVTRKFIKKMQLLTSAYPPSFEGTRGGQEGTKDAATHCGSFPDSCETVGRSSLFTP